MEQLRSNCALMAEIDRIAEVAGYLWTGQNGMGEIFP